ILKARGNTGFTKLLQFDDFSNITTFFDPERLSMQEEYRDEQFRRLRYSGSVYLVQKAGKFLFIEPSFLLSGVDEYMEREQGYQANETSKIDSLSPTANSSFTSMVPGIGIRRNVDKSKLNVRLEYQLSRMNSRVNDTDVPEKSYGYLLPGLSYEYNFNTGKSITFEYRANVNAPSISQLLPVTNTLNPLYLVNGNPDLQPEVDHSVNTHLLFFDQFSFTTIFASMGAGYTKDRINWERTINDDLVQLLQPVNTRYGINVRGTIDFSRPVKQIGMKIHVNAQEQYRLGIAPVNAIENEYTSFIHDLSVSLDNRKKQKWDIKTGIGIRVTDSRFSIQEQLNDVYFDLNWFGEVGYTAGKLWDVLFSADIINYNQKSFEESILVPYLKGEVNFHIPPSGRATIRLRVNDMLNRDTGVERISDLNYLSEIRRNTLGRYVMLSFNYKLNKSEEDQGNIEIEIHGRRR
ncbi:MAG TPA: outer membrane beta-barrel protein, partial [Prolixibacteraceae bacterium]|nr:outer membrane beta-barrel protein [Prolixibacteraceae bacterium]